jgi:aldose 1-epimerase
VPEITLNAEENSSAVISTIGAALLDLTLDFKEVVRKPTDPIKTYAGSVLAPWHNRLEAGSWVDAAGNRQQFAVNEKNKNNALHGLLFKREFDVLSSTSNKLTLSIAIGPESGYPFSLQLEIHYELREAELVSSFRVKNLGTEDAPFAIGFHPYFVVPYPETATFTNTAKSVYKQNENQIPGEKISVEGSVLDFRKGRSCHKLIIDDYFTDLEYSSGISTSSLHTSSWSLDVWQDQSLQHQVVYYTDNFETNSGMTSVIAIEATSAAANSFNNKDGLVWLKPEKEQSGSWGIKLAK